MRTSILVVAIVAGALSAPIVSAHERSAPARAAMRMDLDKQMPQMQGNIEAMQQQLEKARVTADPNERQKLMQGHTQAMQENMKAMRSMGGPMMMGGSQSAGIAMGGNRNMTGGDLDRRQAMMEKRVDMMQMMMEQMLQHDQMTESKPVQ